MHRDALIGLPMSEPGMSAFTIEIPSLFPAKKKEISTTPHGEVGKVTMGRQDPEIEDASKNY